MAEMAEQGNVLLTEFSSNLFVSDKKRHLEIIGVGNHHLAQIDEQQMAVLLLVQGADIAS